jgi:hypothetical protein
MDIGSFREGNKKTGGRMQDVISDFKIFRFRDFEIW